LKAVDTCLPVEKVCSIDEMACKLMGTERQVPVARELALKVKKALREQVGECLTCSIGIAPNVFLGKVGDVLIEIDSTINEAERDRLQKEYMSAAPGAARFKAALSSAADPSVETLPCWPQAETGPWEAGRQAVNERAGPRSPPPDARQDASY